MTSPISPDFVETDLDRIDAFEGKIVCFLTPAGGLDPLSRRVNKLAKGVLARFSESEAFENMKAGAVQVMDFPANIAAKAIVIVKLGRKADAAVARKAGADAAKAVGKSDAMLLAGANRAAGDVVQGYVLRAYDFNDHKSGEKTDQGGLTVLVNNVEETKAAYASRQAANEGVFMTRDLVNEPANVLTTTEFANRLSEMEALGLKVTVLEEAKMEELGMHALLGVGQGSVSPSKIVVMEWTGGGDEQPFALVGKGVVFDTGGISLKPAGGMEDMTMDMGGAGVVAGVMKTLALRKAKANVVGLVGLVENMPDGKAQRPGDVVTSMKGDTIEVINTDAEGRLVLADVLWYAQKIYAPVGMINLATLTGAIIIGLGHENAGVFSNNDELCNRFLKAAGDESEGAWRMPLGDAYDTLIKSRIADIKNTGGRAAGSITAGQFLQRFVEPGMPWIHLDIAGVASIKSATALAPAGATGWGVRALDRLIADNYEQADG
ncbi:leucyl aminopeptidase [Neptunicoccus cionae]|uniref:Probable cytosol aminopeptidase n=1 Tax=Neptunicoccus cionae TaxID=2035344 RepID=A0A916R0R4_9RHOB|nr:leucyl aminopeptidase [Amylibacter cionae]GGA24726.1 putative cytosol aminopeptidase [Amylibacter cionae]